MDDLRIQLERRQASLRGLSGPSPLLEWLLCEGTALDTAPEPWSEAERRLVSLLSRSLRFRRAQCFANAQQAVLLARRLGVVAAGHSLEYWEGFAYLPMPAPFAHGWCLLNGRVWDPSLDHLEIPVRYLGAAIPCRFVEGTVAGRRTYAPLLQRWHAHLNGVGASAVERTGRVASAVYPRAGLAGAPPRL